MTAFLIGSVLGVAGGIYLAYRFELVPRVRWVVEEVRAFVRLVRTNPR